MVVPPWWIIHDVKPAGPEKDMGSWKAISFSAEQQRQFGIDDSGTIKDQAAFDRALQAHKAGGQAQASSGEVLVAELLPSGPAAKRWRVSCEALGGAELAPAPDGSGKLVLRPKGSVGCLWSLSKASGEGLVRLSVAPPSPGPALCLDVPSPGQAAVVSPEADVPGQQFKLRGENGCKKLEGGAVARCLLGYTLRPLNADRDSVLSAEDAAGEVTLKPEGDSKGQVWEISNDRGQPWMHGQLDKSDEEPEIAICDFGGPPEPVLSMGP